MDELIARVLSGEAGELETRRLDEWRRASPDNELRYRDLAEVWRLGSAAGPAVRVPPAPKAAAIMAEAERRRAGAIQLASRRLPRVSGWWWAAAAAAVVAVGAGAGWWWRSAAVSEYATGPGGTRTVTLSDGSLVRLGPRSRLRVARADQRSMELRGIAFFAVATDSTRPFVVRSDLGSARVLGTRFEMRAGADSLRLVVVEGRVKLSAGGAEVDVPRGGVGRVAGGSGPSVTEAPDVWSLLDWPGGTLLFQATPLSEVLREVGAHFGRPVAIGDSALARRTVTAWFENEPLDVVVSTVCLVVGASCVVGDTVEVTRPAPRR